MGQVADLSYHSLSEVSSSKSHEDFGLGALGASVITLQGLFSHPFQEPIKIEKEACQYVNFSDKMFFA